MIAFVIVWALAAAYTPGPTNIVIHPEDDSYHDCGYVAQTGGWANDPTNGTNCYMVKGPFLETLLQTPYLAFFTLSLNLITGPWARIATIDVYDPGYFGGGQQIAMKDVFKANFTAASTPQSFVVGPFTPPTTASRLCFRVFYYTQGLLINHQTELQQQAFYFPQLKLSAQQYITDIQYLVSPSPGPNYGGIYGNDIGIQFRGFDRGGGTAQFDDAWSSNGGTGYFLFGGHFRTIPHVAYYFYFTVSIDNIGGSSSDAVVYVDIHDNGQWASGWSGTGQTLGSTNVMRSQFAAANVPTMFVLSFTSYSYASMIQPRFYAYLPSTKVTVYPMEIRPKTPAYSPNFFYNAQGSSMSHECGSAIPAITSYPGFAAIGWQQQQGGQENCYMVYGPYVTVLPAKTYNVLFTLAIDNNSMDNANVAILDCCNSGSTLSSLTVTRQMFTSPTTTQAFTLSFTTTASSSMEFRVKYLSGAQIAVFGIEVQGLPSIPTPSPSNWPSRTPNWSVTSSPTSTPSVTPTRTITPSVTPSRTASVSVSVTPTATPSASPTISDSGSQSTSPTATQTPSRSDSVTPTSSVTPTASVTPTSSVTPTASVTSSPSISPTASVTPTASETPSASATATSSVTPTTSLSVSRSFSCSASDTAVSSATASVSVSGSASVSPSTSTTITPTATMSPSITDTSSSTSSPSSTASASDSGTSSASSSVSPAPSVSATTTVSETSSTTPSTSRSATASVSGSSSATAAPTASATPTSTQSLTATFTVTSTNTASPSSPASTTATPVSFSPAAASIIAIGPTAPNDSNPSLPMWLIVVIVLAAAAMVTLIALAIFVCIRASRRRRPVVPLTGNSDCDDEQLLMTLLTSTGSTTKGSEGIELFDNIDEEAAENPLARLETHMGTQKSNAELAEPEDLLGTALLIAEARPTSKCSRCVFCITAFHERRHVFAAVTTIVFVLVLVALIACKHLPTPPEALNEMDDWLWPILAVVEGVLGILMLLLYIPKFAEKKCLKKIKSNKAIIVAAVTLTALLCLILVLIFAKHGSDTPEWLMQLNGWLKPLMAAVEGLLAAAAVTVFVRKKVAKNVEEVVTNLTGSYGSQRKRPVARSSTIVNRLASEQQSDRASARASLAQSGPMRMEVPFIEYDDLILGAVVGRGQFAEVLKGQWHGVDVAVKRLFPSEGQDLAGMLIEEGGAMINLRHPRILLLLGIVVDPRALCIVTHYYPQGSLFNVIHRSGGQVAETLPMRRRLQIMTEIAAGMGYLHAQLPPIVHRDLKSKNIMVADDYHIYIGDFGVSRAAEMSSTMTTIGTPQWMAPEVLRGDRYDERADVYSFAIVMYELLELKIPFAGCHPMRVSEMVAREGARPPLSPFPAHPALLVALMKRCWAENPPERPTFQQCFGALSEFDVI